MKQEPLYLLASNNSLGNVQMMDTATLNWMETKLHPVRVSVADVFPHYEPIDSLYLKKFIPSKKWFLNIDHYSTIHGIRHILRVVIYSTLLCQLEEMEPASLLRAASIHDIRR